MPRDLDLSNAESHFLSTLLHSHNSRLSHRQLLELRAISISFPSPGLCALNFGQTSVTVHISASIVKTLPDRPFDGQFLVTCDFSAFSHSDQNDARDEELLVSRNLEKSVRRSRALETEGLCIQAGNLCWLIRATCHVLNHDGNILDALSLALVAALKRFRKPVVEVKGEEVVVYSIRERDPERLVMNFLPIAITFSFFTPPASLLQAQGKQESKREDLVVLVDCSKDEERERSGYLTVSLTNRNELCQITKSGGCATSPDIIKKCLAVGKVVASDLTELVEKRVKEDEEREAGSGKRVDGKSSSDRVEGDRPVV